LSVQTSFLPSPHALLWALIQRDFRERYIGTASGLLWAFLGPALTLLIYAFVFQTLMKVRVPSIGAAGFVPFLALGLWPWYAFSDAVARGTTAIVSNAPLLGKIAMPRYVLVLVPVLSSFAIHMLGLIAVIVALAATGTALHWAALPLVLACLLGMLVLSIGIAFWLATLNVFLRDVSAMLPQLLTFWMLITPIFFHGASLSPAMLGLLSHNPMLGFIDALRAGLLQLPGPTPGVMLEACLWSLLALFSGGFVFARSAPHFEDYL